MKTQIFIESQYLAYIVSMKQTRGDHKGYIKRAKDFLRLWGVRGIVLSAAPILFTLALRVTGERASVQWVSGKRNSRQYSE